MTGGATVEVEVKGELSKDMCVKWFIGHADADLRLQLRWHQAHLCV